MTVTGLWDKNKGEWILGTKSLFVSVVVICLTLAGCGKATSSAAQSSPDNQTNNSNPQSNSNSGTQALVVYKTGESPTLNEFRAVNVNAGQLTFDFAFTPDQDETLTLHWNTVKSMLLGCDNTDLGFQFSLYRVGADGAIDLSGYDGLGESPTLVKQGVPYIARVTLFLKKSCLGIDFEFGMMINHSTGN